MIEPAFTDRADTRAHDRMFAMTWLIAGLALIAGAALYLKFGLPPHVSEAISAEAERQDVTAIVWPSTLACFIAFAALMLCARYSTPRLCSQPVRLIAWLIAALACASLCVFGYLGVLGVAGAVPGMLAGVAALGVVGFSAGRSVKNYVFTYTATTVAVASVVMLGVLLTSIVSQGWSRINNLNLEQAREAMQPQKITKFSELEEQVHWSQQARDLNRPELAVLDEVDWTKVADQAGVYFVDDLDDYGFEIIRDEQGIENLPIFTAEEWQEIHDRLRIAGMGTVEAYWKNSELGQFLTSSPSRFPEQAGIGPALWGTVWICIVCGIVALPLGVGTAVFLEEFRPKNSAVRKLRDFVQLNIANLAGVPSIVYGIIGLTAFVSMFGLFGNPNAPDLTIGDVVYDEFRDMTGAMLRIDRPDQTSPQITLESGLTAIDEETGASVTLTMFDADSLPADPQLGHVAMDASPQRRVKYKWYYVQLPFGRGVLAGGLTLMLVILPIVVISSQESLRAVPDSLRHGALAIGATRWQMISRMTLPAAIPGIMTGSILAMSRAIGEAAPILILAGIVFITFNPGHLMDDFTAMPLQIYDWAGRPQAEFHTTAAAGIMILLAVLLSFNAIAIFIRQKYQKPLQ